jgi:formiminotetrahydrofolate cyclodeaminase
MLLVDKTVSQLLDAFASSDPTPGGGSASALAGAIGCSLLLMVAHMPKSKTGPEVDRAPLDGVIHRIGPLASEMRTLLDRDAAAYEQVVGAYRMPKSTDPEKAARREAIQRAMRAAIEAPLAVMRACRTALDDVKIVKEHGNPNAGSDITVAAELLRAGLNGAKANVEINLGSVSDAAYAEAVRKEIVSMQ